MSLLLQRATEEYGYLLRRLHYPPFPGCLDWAQSDDAHSSEADEPSEASRDL